MKALDLDPQERLALAEKVIAALVNAVPGSNAVLRGSLAEGTADPWSDIDLLWEIPDKIFVESVDCLEGILSSVQSLDSLRSDPDFQNSGKHRLFFAQFAGVPLFWRVDIEVFAASIHWDAGYDQGNQAARGDNWSPTHSALMNAVAALKAMLRDREEVTRQLLDRGFERIGLTAPPGSPGEQVLFLCETVASMDPAKKDLAGRIMAVHKQVFS